MKRKTKNTINKILLENSGLSHSKNTNTLTYGKNKSIQKTTNKITKSLIKGIFK